jgi:hypothetical protein
VVRATRDPPLLLLLSRSHGGGLNSGPKPLRGSALRVRATARTHPAEESMHEPVFGWVLTAAAKSVVRPSRRAPSTGPGPAAGPSGTRTACATPSVGSRTRSTRRGLPRQRRPQRQLQARPLRSDRVHRDDPPARAHARLRVGQLHRLTSRRTGDAQPRQCGGSGRLLSYAREPRAWRRPRGAGCSRLTSRLSGKGVPSGRIGSLLSYGREVHRW